jgi:hypothetical protein
MELLLFIHGHKPGDLRRGGDAQRPEQWTGTVPEHSMPEILAPLAQLLRQKAVARLRQTLTRPTLTWRLAALFPRRNAIIDLLNVFYKSHPPHFLERCNDFSPILPAVAGRRRCIRHFLVEIRTLILTITELSRDLKMKKIKTFVSIFGGRVRRFRSENGPNGSPPTSRFP